MDNWRQNETNTSGNPEDRKAWMLIENLAMSALKEQRRTRRWGIFFKFLIFAWLLTITTVIFKSSSKLKISSGTGSNTHTALIEMNGVIADGGDISADIMIEGLKAAFENPKTKAIIIKINSPGGSPVQSGYIYDEIIRLRKLHFETPIYAVITDIGASGGYYIASAADAIYADKASLIGSIGVIAAGFGFVGAIERLGVTRRNHTAGEHKASMDPFLPINDEASKHWQESLDIIHKQFIKSVKHGRGDRLHTDHPKIFSGMVWTGEKAKTLGLVDGLGSAEFVARDIIGEEKIVDFTPHMSPIERFTKNLGVGVSQALLKLIGENTYQIR